MGAPGIIYFNSIQELLCQLVEMNVSEVVKTMRRHNEDTTLNSIDFWGRVMMKLVGHKGEGSNAPIQMKTPPHQPNW